jgi:hypothetical protein
VNTLITIWRAQLMQDVGYTAALLVERATDRTVDKLPTMELYELLLQQAGTPRGDIDARKVGNWLMAIRGRIHDGYYIDRVTESIHGNRYALRRA